ncbi:uncharacterized protein LOC124438567 isoform X2 [Xenia sp. Carnegie-2017]|nr:uncharacterized protein LOC124438567 isoform X2 [Xenia sp. Carnegie-2017]
MIGRKRYSGYRAMLYSRNDQIKNIRKTNSPIQMISIRNKRLTREQKTKRKSQNELTRERRTKRKSQNEINTVDKTQLAKTSNTTDFNCREFYETLDDALSEINKKIAKQKSIWMILKSDK